MKTNIQYGWIRIFILISIILLGFVTSLFSQSSRKPFYCNKGISFELTLNIMNSNDLRFSSGYRFERTAILISYENYKNFSSVDLRSIYYVINRRVSLGTGIYVGELQDSFRAGTFAEGGLWLTHTLRFIIQEEIFSKGIIPDKHYGTRIGFNMRF